MSRKIKEDIQNILVFLLCVVILIIGAFILKDEMLFYLSPIISMISVSGFMIVKIMLERR